MDPGYEEPTVTISSFRALPSDGMVPKFEIGLNILNPNASSFRLDGSSKRQDLDNTAQESKA